MQPHSSDDRQCDRAFDLTSDQVAEALEVTTNNLRQLKARNLNRLTEGVHWVRTDKNFLLWSAIGVEELRKIRNEEGGNGPSNEVVTASNEVVTASNEVVTPPLQRVARFLAQRQIARELGPAIAVEREELLNQLLAQIEGEVHPPSTWAADQMERLQQAREHVYVLTGVA